MSGQGGNAGDQGVRADREGGADSRYVVPGLRRPVELIVDRWGVPHIYAQTADDAFVAQGFNAARDRLFQIDLWRRRGLGRLAEVFGADYVEQDRAARLFLYRGDMASEWAAYSPDAEQIATSFVAGVNAYVDWVNEHPGALPPEFAMLDYRPSRWSAEDVVRIRSHGIAMNVVSEVTRARTARVARVEDDLVRRRLEPSHVPYVPDGFDADLPADVLRTYELAVRPVTFTGDPDHPIALYGGAHLQGSNNWAVAGTRTATGRPILAGDPHRAYTTPSLRYIAHLSAPGLDVIGAGEPALPGVSIGHNGTIAFAFTIFPIDHEDLYVYELDPSDPRRYRYGGRWEAFHVVREQVAVRGQAPREVELPFSRHGPVIQVDAPRHRAFAVRTTWTAPGTAPYFGSIAYLHARSWEEFERAVARCRAPGENFVYADTGGTIGWKAAGLVPRRVGYDGLLPVPGDGRYEWDGWYAAEEMPVLQNPGEGFVATANQLNLPADYPPDRRLSFEWSDPARHRRIVEALSANRRLSLADAQRLQVDVLSVAARDVVAVLAAIEADDPTEKAALALLTSWDAVESADSAAAALYETWMTRHLRPGFARAVLPAGVATVIASADPVVTREALRNPASWFGADAEAKRDALVRSTLGAAYEEVAAQLGDDPAVWQWGDLHRNLQPHPLGGLDPSLDVGPVGIGGSSTTVAAGTYRPEDFRQTGGASFRMVLDVGEWDDSVAVNTPGQSGDPRSPHYRDLAETWSADAYFPLLYTRAAVERHATDHIRLEPAR